MTELTPDRCLHELFEESARHSPHALAVVDGQQRLTYAELDALATRIAHTLSRVTPETLVGVLADRSVHAVAAFLGVLKAGGAYVPIDPANPPHRLGYLLADAGVTTVLTRDRHRDRLPEGPWSVVALDGDLPAGEGPASAAHADNLAYAIYTSGSTGSPKGVLVSHRQIVRSTLAQFAYDRPDPGVFLLLPSLSFDAAADGLYWTLTAGGTVVLPDERILLDPLALRELIAAECVTHSDCTPSLYSLILGDDAEGLSSLRCVKVGGEACPPDLLRRHHALLPEAVLVNNYGPTEATVWATTYVSRTSRLPGTTVPIGAPIPHARVYLLDERLERVPSGETGELYIAGAGVARGYLGRGGLTAERFLPDPYCGGARMYRTGDLAREGAGGLLEFAGRTDDQVKIRGYRIELGEIENALAEHQKVLVAAVVAHDLDGTTPQLAAYVQTGAGVEELRDFLADRLPTHLIPRHIIAVEQMPRTISGKIDKAALPRPEAVRDYVEPRTELERQVAAMVSEILGAERVGLSDNLFDLGASSLHISQLALRIWTELGAMVAVHALFEIPTVAGTALAIEALKLQDHNAWDLDRLAAECELDSSIDATGLPSARLTDPRVVLMTGVTGYLGAHLLERVLRTPTAEVVCLVRAADPEAGLARIRDTMAAYRIEADLGRVRVLVGDLGEPRLGLTETAWDDLASCVDAIFHTGALVNFLYPYSKLKGPNVEGTVEILRLASTTTVKAVHYVSSIDSFLNTGLHRPFLEDPPLAPTEVPDGYPRSKYVAEQRVTAARERGIPACVYRTGMIIGHTVSGATAPDYMLLQIKGMLVFGVVPAADGLVDAIPVDFAAGAIAQIASRPDSLGRSFHLWNPEMTSFEQIYEWIRSYGYLFESASEQVVMEKVLTIELDNPLFPLLPLYADPKWRDQPDDLQPAKAALIDVRTELANTLHAIEGSGLACAPLTEEYVHRSIDFMIETGFLDAPQVQRSRLTRGE